MDKVDVVRVERSDFVDNGVGRPWLNRLEDCWYVSVKDVLAAYDAGEIFDLMDMLREIGND